MLKRLCLALAGLFCVVSLAQGAGTVPGFSLVPQFDLSAKVAPGCKLYVIQAGTVSTPQNAYQDSSLTLLQPNPMLCDAAGRLPQWFVADGSIKLRLTDKNGIQIFVQDGLLVVGASSGGGGGSPVDPTTILATGDIKVAYGTGILSGFVRANGRTIGSATSGATERANLDTQALFQYLWGADANLAVSGGRGASAAADWSANKTIALPDWAGRTLAGLDDMGAGAKGRLISAYFGSSPTVLGAAGGQQAYGLVTANLPPYTPAGSITGSVASGAATAQQRSASVTGSNDTSTVALGTTTGTYLGNIAATWFTGATVTGTLAGTPQGGTSQGFSLIQPTMLATIYLKL